MKYREGYFSYKIVGISSGLLFALFTVIGVKYSSISFYLRTFSDTRLCVLISIL